MVLKKKLVCDKKVFAGVLILYLRHMQYRFICICINDYERVFDSLIHCVCVCWHARARLGARECLLVTVTVKIIKVGVDDQSVFGTSKEKIYT